MSTLIAKPPASPRRKRQVDDEQPITLKEIQERRPDVPRWLVYYITLHHCTAYEYGDGDVVQCETWAACSGNYRNAKYLLSEFDAALRKREERRRVERKPADTFEFTDREGTWVAEEKLPRRIDRSTAERMERDGLIRPARHVEIVGSVLPRRFWHLNDLTEALKVYDTPLLQRNKVRTKAEMEKLSDDEKVSRREAKMLGFSERWLKNHSDVEHPQRKRPKIPAEPIGRLIHGENRQNVVTGAKKSYRTVFDPWFRPGDLRECLEVRDNPKVPEGGRLVRRGIEAELAREGILPDRQSTRFLLVHFIQQGIIRGGQITTFTKTFKKNRPTWWMMWEDREKIRSYTVERLPRGKFKTTPIPAAAQPGSTPPPALEGPARVATTPGPPKKPRHRPPKYDPQEDKKWHDDYKASGLKLPAFARERGKPIRLIDTAIKRHRDRVVRGVIQ